jgi:signal transduction histidine kinase
MFHWLCGFDVRLVLQHEFVEVGRRAVAVEIDGGLDVLVADEGIAVERDERDERGRDHRAHELPDRRAERAVATGERVAQLTFHPLRAERLGAGDTAGVEHERGCPASGELGDASERVGVGERAVELGLDDRVELAWFVAAGVADGLLAFGVGPAGAVGDQLAVVAFATSAATAVAAARTVASEVQRQRLAAAEGERGRWARELHDETLQILAALRVSLSQAHRVGDLQILTEAVGQAIEDIEEGISTLRSLVTELRPVALDELSLEAAVESLCERASRHGSRSTARSTWHTSGREPTRHTAELETAMYRIIQEALTNAAKHGHAKRAAIGNP